MMTIYGHDHSFRAYAKSPKITSQNDLREVSRRSITAAPPPRRGRSWPRWVSGRLAGQDGVADAGPGQRMADALGDVVLRPPAEQAPGAVDAGVAACRV